MPSIHLSPADNLLLREAAAEFYRWECDLRRKEVMESNITIGDKYKPAMELTDQATADAYFEECVQHCMSFGRTREEAEKIEHANLGYFAGYYSEETRERVERLFNCSHPIFGKIAVNGRPTAGEALKAGMQIGRRV